MDVSIRPARDADLPAIARIGAHYVRHSVVTFDTEPRTVPQWRTHAAAIAAAGWPFLVAAADEDVVGYGYVTAWRPKPAYRHSVEPTVYLDPSATGRGVGTTLLAAVLAAATVAGARQAIAVIAHGGDEQRTIRMNRRLGFELVGTLRAVGFKHGRWIDTTLMQAPLGPTR